MAVGLKDLRVKLKTSVEYNFMSVIYLSFSCFRVTKDILGKQQSGWDRKIKKQRSSFES